MSVHTAQTYSAECFERIVPDRMMLGYSCDDCEEAAGCDDVGSYHSFCDRLRCPRVFESALLESCQYGCGSGACCDELFIPNMIGSGGLSMPKVFRPLGGGPFAFKHRHFSKVSDNNSPIPRDRVYYSYDLYNHTILLESLGMGRINAELKSHRFGIEKTIFDGRVSLELIVPFHHTTDSNVRVALNQEPLLNTEFGQLAFGGKVLLRRTGNSALSAGLRIECPTDDDFGFGPLYHQTNAFNFTPYLAYVRKKDQWNFQTFVSYRMHDRNMVRLINGVPREASRDPDTLSLDVSVGRWLRRRPNARFLTGLLPSVELHYQGQYQGEAYPSFQGLIYGDSIDNLSLTIGLTAIIGKNTTLTTGYATPLRRNVFNGVSGPLAGYESATDRYAEGIFLLQLNHYFGKK